MKSRACPSVGAPAHRSSTHWAQLPAPTPHYASPLHGETVFLSQRHWSRRPGGRPPQCRGPPPPTRFPRRRGAGTRSGPPHAGSPPAPPARRQPQCDCGHQGGRWGGGGSAIGMSASEWGRAGRGAHGSCVHHPLQARALQREGHAQRSQLLRQRLHQRVSVGLWQRQHEVEATWAQQGLWREREG